MRKMDKIKVMVNGIPGNMARNVARHISGDDRFKLILFSLTGSEIVSNELITDHSQKIVLIRPDQRKQAIARIQEKEGAFISVDFTHPLAVNSNAEFYCKHILPFVMGTTGGNRDLLKKTVKNSAITAVIAPNMAKQIVGFQAMMKYAADIFPNLFSGYFLEIKESHQKGKSGTSGTAEDMVEIFNKLGIPFSKRDIVMERDSVNQIALGVPKQHLGGHGYHTYTLISSDKTVKIEFTHNVNGRDIYARGTLDAIFFLDKEVNKGTKGKVFTMINVLKG